jgi:hypothetical protein
LLKRANISYHSLALQDWGELCKILGVDATLKGKAALSKPISDGSAVALTLLVGYGGMMIKQVLHFQ